MKPPPADNQPENHDKLLREVYQKCRYRLVVHLTDLLGNEDEALDISQEVLIRFYNALRRGRKIEKPMNFLLRTSNRLAMRHLQKLRRRERTIFQPAEKIQSDLELQEAWSTLKHIWPRLDAGEKLVAKSVLIDQMNLKEIVDSTEFSRSSVQRKISDIHMLVESAAKEMAWWAKKVGQIRPVIASLRVEKDEEPDDR